MNKIRIIDVASTDQGAYRLLRSRVKKIASDERFENIILCHEGPWQKMMIDEGVQCISYNVHRKLGIRGIWSEIKELEKILLENNPHIVHSHNSKTGALARIAVKHLNKKYGKKIVMIHQVHGYHFTGLKGIKRYLFFLIEKILGKMTDILLFQNQYELILSKKYAMDKNSDLVYIGNGINLKEVEEVQLTLEHRDEIRIVCIARIEPIKNHGMLLRALGLLKNKYNINNFKAKLIGEGDTKQLMAYIKESHLEDNVILTGPLDRKEVINEIYNSDISVLTSIKEGKPRALIESMFLGKPCVATNVVGTNEVVRNNVTGYLVKLDDYEEFAIKVKELIENKSIYHEFSKNSKQVAYKEFNEDIVLQKIKDIYLKVAEEEK